VDGEWIPLSKGDKARMRDILLASLAPALAVIAVSGQKHIIFRARPGWWQIEEQAARPFPDELASLIALVEELYNGGISKGEIEAGRYSHYRIMNFGFERWREIESVLRPRRVSLPLQAAVFLAQLEKDDGESDGQVRDGGLAADADLAGDPGRL